MKARTPGGRVPLIWAEAALCVLSLTVVVSMRRLFDSWDYLPVLATTTVVAHATASISRRQRWTIGATVPVSAVTAVLLSAVLIYPETLLMVVPGFETWRLMASELGEAWTAFGRVEAPTPATGGFLVGASALLWLIAGASDIAAFRLRTMTEALLAPLALFVFVAVLGVGGYRLETAGALVGAAWLFLLLARTSSPVSHSVPLAATEDRQRRTTLSLGLRMVCGAVIIGILAGPLLPGVGEPGVIALKDLEGGSGPRVTLSPLVDARGRLIEQSNTELFRVRADQAAYWRVSGLDEFNGTVWGSNRSYSSGGGRLRDVSDDVPTLEQRITISGLSSIWIPAAYEPVRLRGEDISWDDVTGTLVIQRGQSVAPGTTYTVVSALDVPSPEELRSAPTEVPAEIATEYTALPAGFSTDIRLLAEQVTAGAGNTFDRAIALQTFFRESFVYSLDAVAGHDTERMENFLFQDRRGYCEQFAGSFAAMARSLGIPARVAVGFTPGERVGDEFIVRGEHYHAWPEVWIGGQWVYFEPTPGRGAPLAQTYTGVAPQQAVSGDPLGIPAQELGPGGAGDGGQTTEGPTTDNPGFVDDLTLADQSTPRRLAPWVRWTLIVITAALVAALLWILVFPSMVAVRRRRRRARAADDACALAGEAWSDFCSRLAVAGITHQEHETHAQFVRRVAADTRLAAAPLTDIAATADRASFSDLEPSLDEVREMVRLVDQVDTDLQHGLGWSERLRQRSDPRILSRTSGS